MSANNRDLYVGVDLGGTKILAGVFDSQLALLGTAKLSTKSLRGPEAVIARIARCVRDAVDECDLDFGQVRAVGVGAPGAVDPRTGRVIVAPNLHGWRDVPLQRALEKELARPVCIANDCNAATLGVFEKEFKARPRHLVGLFLGTGIGGGFIFNGELYQGHNLAAGEVGHMVLEINGPKCACGNRGCFEALASRTAIFRKIHHAVKAGQKTLLTDMLGDDLKDMRSGDLRRAIRRGDLFVEKVVQEAAGYTGIAVANLINILSPELVVIGGGLIEQLGEEMLPVILRTAQEHVLPGAFKAVEIKLSRLGDDAGITGAAVLARRALPPQQTLRPAERRAIPARA
jgi:glucokinase